MDIKETGLVLVKIQAYTNRAFDKLEIMAWHESISDLEVKDVLAAVTEHYRKTDKWATPYAIRSIVAKKNRDPKWPQGW